MGRLESKHWALIAGFLASTATVIGGLDHWVDLLKPAVVAGLLGQTSILLGAVYAGAPPNPNLNPIDNPHRRETDPAAPPLGSVTDATRRNLP